MGIRGTPGCELSRVRTGPRVHRLRRSLASAEGATRPRGRLRDLEPIWRAPVRRSSTLCGDDGLDGPGLARTVGFVVALVDEDAFRHARPVARHLGQRIACHARRRLTERGARPPPDDVGASDDDDLVAVRRPTMKTSRVSRRATPLPSTMIRAR